jgi:hypothetical protein
MVFRRPGSQRRLRSLVQVLLPLRHGSGNARQERLEIVQVKMILKTQIMKIMGGLKTTRKSYRTHRHSGKGVRIY